jgi:hypothetical protein
MKIYPLNGGLLIIAFLSFLVSEISARTINWYVTPQKINLRASGLPMGDGFEFQLGSFTAGFVPSPDNLAQWQDHWVASDSGAYNSVTHSFSENYLVENNTSPFSFGANAYVWGRSSSTTGDEWILLRKSDWKWPAPDPLNPTPLFWNAATADQVILGAINTTGIPFLMRLESIQSYAQWRNDFLANEPLGDPNDDPDHDGTINSVEFCFGSNPSVPTSPAQVATSVVAVNGLNYLQVSVPRIRNRLALLSSEISTDLLTWSSDPAQIVQVSSSIGSWVFRDALPLGMTPSKRFYRTKVVLVP